MTHKPIMVEINKLATPIIKNMCNDYLLISRFIFYISKIAKVACLENSCHFGLDDRSRHKGDSFPQLVPYSICKGPASMQYPDNSYQNYEASMNQDCLTFL